LHSPCACPSWVLSVSQAPFILPVRLSVSQAPFPEQAHETLAFELGSESEGDDEAAASEGVGAGDAAALERSLDRSETMYYDAGSPPPLPLSFLAHPCTLLGMHVDPTHTRSFQAQVSRCWVNGAPRPPCFLSAMRSVYGWSPFLLLAPGGGP
jgi:hypothetical protein